MCYTQVSNRRFWCLRKLGMFKFVKIVINTTEGVAMVWIIQS